MTQLEEMRCVFLRKNLLSASEKASRGNTFTCFGQGGIKLWCPIIFQGCIRFCKFPWKPNQHVYYFYKRKSSSWEKKVDFKQTFGNQPVHQSESNNGKF